MFLNLLSLQYKTQIENIKPENVIVSKSSPPVHMTVNIPLISIKGKESCSETIIAARDFIGLPIAVDSEIGYESFGAVFVSLTNLSMPSWKKNLQITIYSNVAEVLLAASEKPRTPALS